MTTNNLPTIPAFIKENEQSLLENLPKAANSDRALRQVALCLKNEPKLMSCSHNSLLAAFSTVFSYGLELGPVLGQSYLLPYGQTCQFIIGYRGMLELCRRSGEIKDIKARVVHENDDFKCIFGNRDTILHTPALTNRGKVTHVYGVALLTNGAEKIEVMNLEEVENIRKRSKASKSGPWVTDFNEMAKKTIVRNMFKYLPVSVEAQAIVMLDEAADRGKQFDYFDGDFSEEPNLKKKVSKSDLLGEEL